MLGNYADALRAFETEPVALFSQVGVAITQDKLGDRDAAQQAFNAMLEDYGDAGLYQQAQVYAQWGDDQQALQLLDRAFAEADPGVLFAPNDPLLDPIRSDPAVLPLLERLSL